MEILKRIKSSACVLGVLFLFLSTLALADEVFVDSRNETGPWNGSVDYPFETIRDAIDAGTTYDGDTIRVSDGIYKSISVDKHLKIYGAGPDITSIDATLTGEDSAVLVQQNIELTISGFSITSSLYGIKILNYSETIIANNIIVGEYGIHCSNNAQGANIEIQNNTINGCAMDGIFLDSSSINRSIAKIYNNIITSNGRYGIYHNNDFNLSIYFNDVWNNGTANYYNCGGGSGAILENPRFIDVATGNYRLQLLSPCIDAGWPVKAKLDPDGTQNNMGAYGGPGAAIFWPDSPGAPVVSDLSVTPAAVPSNGTITVRAIGRVRPYSSGQE